MIRTINKGSASDLLMVSIGGLYAQKYTEYMKAISTFNSVMETCEIDYRLEPQHEDKGDGYYSIPSPELIIDAGQLIYLMTNGYSVSIKSKYEIKTTDAYLKNVADAAEKILNKLAEIDTKTFPEQTYNERCEVHVPGIGLLAINRTMLLEDICTDELNTALANGWRIIAACPQPDQRRPDYILGKYDPNWEPCETVTAERNARAK